MSTNKIVNYLLATLIILMLPPVSLMAWQFALCAPAASPNPSSGARLADDGTLTISGAIDPAMIDNIRNALVSATRPIRAIAINSPGGLVDLLPPIEALLQPLHVPVEVPSGAACQSACVGLLAASAQGIVIAPTATLMFHSEAKQYGSTAGPLCGCVANALWWLSIRFRFSEPVMMPWARELSESLPVVFGLCKRNPLYTRRGITISGAEFNGLRDGSISPSMLLGPVRIL